MLSLYFIFKYARNIIFFHFKFLKANLRGGKGGTFIVGPGQHLASLCHCAQTKVSAITDLSFAILRVNTCIFIGFEEARQECIN